MLRRLFFLFTAIILMASCTNYQYVYLSSDLPKTTDSEHYYVSDSLIYVDFDFNGNRFPVKLYFLNESEIPVYFDLTETLFFENGSLVQSAYRLADGALEERVLIPAGKGAAFQFRPYRTELMPVVKAQSDYIEISDGVKKESALGKELESVGREFEIQITYRFGENEEAKTSLSAKFKEDHIYFTTREPANFPGGSSPYCYYLAKESESGQIATSLLFEVASASLYYLMLESLE
ncbi:hypothetical protein O3Q51_11930 [Cryomorphaceae bacterium 1068]|nr:hypothetical protein [Cryomorphaceae bacterium 1068]